jgi:hypothetical protein
MLTTIKRLKMGGGGGVALLFRDSIWVSHLTVDFSPASYEYLLAALSVNGTTFCLVDTDLRHLVSAKL